MKFYAEKDIESGKKVAEESRLIKFPDGKPVPVGFARRLGETQLEREVRRVLEHIILLTLGYGYTVWHRQTPEQRELEKRLKDGEITTISFEYEGKGIFAKLLTPLRALASYGVWILNQIHPEPPAVSQSHKNEANKNAGPKDQKSDEKKEQAEKAFLPSFNSSHVVPSSNPTSLPKPNPQNSVSVHAAGSGGTSLNLK